MNNKTVGFHGGYSSPTQDDRDLGLTISEIAEYIGRKGPCYGVHHMREPSECTRPDEWQKDQLKKVKQDIQQLKNNPQGLLLEAPHST
ncbi:hypothetical protein MKW98_023079 [Papaver atlanticum]|uniref:Uncharacterized protein n=1 Tax=Papaver atlanticum TaxID=357466 RepID=A0AAD4XUC7_9MAGN|nr:hypothetical protein MKW98_023079 [Papaver atlanticum]